MFDINQAAEFLGVKPVTIYGWIKFNKIQVIKGAKTYSFDETEINRIKSLLDRGLRLPIIPKAQVVDLSKVEPVNSDKINSLDKRMEAKKVAFELRSVIGQVDDNWGIKTKIQKAIDFLTREYRL